MTPLFKAVMMFRHTHHQLELSGPPPRFMVQGWINHLKFYVSDKDLTAVTELLTAGPRDLCVLGGLPSLTRLSVASGQSLQTLTNWHRDKPKLFDLTLLGVVTLEALNEPDYLRVRVLDAAGEPLPMQNFNVEVVK